MVTKSARTRSGDTKRSKVTKDESAAQQCDDATDAIVNDPAQIFSKAVQLLTTLESSDDEVRPPSFCSQRLFPVLNFQRLAFPQNLFHVVVEI
jgi:hypothetical protein